MEVVTDGGMRFYVHKSSFKCIFGFFFFFFFFLFFFFIFFFFPFFYFLFLFPPASYCRHNLEIWGCLESGGQRAQYWDVTTSYDAICTLVN